MSSKVLLTSLCRRWLRKGGTVVLLVATTGMASASDAGSDGGANLLLQTPAPMDMLRALGAPRAVLQSPDMGDAWAALAQATRRHQLLLTGASLTAGETGPRLTASWRGAYGALLRAVDDVLALVPALALARLELRRASDAADIDGRVVFKLAPPSPAVPAR